MGKVILFNQSRPPKPNTPELVVDAPKVRALKRLAETLEKTRLTPSDRARVATNWHAVLKALKHSHGLTKEKVYEVLQSPDSTDSAQKKSWNYEIPPTLTDAARTERIRKLTQRGDKWLKLAERAASLVGMGRHDLLPELLRGTSIAPPTTTSNLEAPDPIASLLQLANAACAKIANRVHLKRYFADWKQDWVRYRPKDGAFLPEPLDGLDESEVAWMGRQACELSEEWSDREFLNGIPLPYVAFARCARFSFRARLVADSESHLDNVDGRIVEVSYMREFGLAIAVNAYDGTISPALEVRHFPVLRDTETREHIPFWPMYGFPDAPGFFKSYHQHKDWADDDDPEVFIYNLRGELELAGQKLWAWLAPQMTAEDVERHEEAFTRSDHHYPEQKPELEIHYSLLTPQTVKTILNVGCEATRKLTVKMILNVSGEATRSPGDQRTLTESSGEGLSILEAMLLEGTADGSLFDLLLKDARRKVEGFRQAYDRVLRGVQEDHRNALLEFS